MDMQVNLIFIWMVLHKDSFWHRGKTGNSEMAYCEWKLKDQISIGTTTQESVIFQLPFTKNIPSYSYLKIQTHIL